MPNDGKGPFLYLPSRLDLPYLASVLSREKGRVIQIVDCRVTNLCAHNWGGVSNSGATVLRLSLKLQEGQALDLVAKILSPDVVNLFKLDCVFDAREAEVAWAKWWGSQAVRFVARAFDTRCDRQFREFWIIEEYFPAIGWADVAVSEMKQFVAAPERLGLLFEHAAAIHAHSSNHRPELEALFPSLSPAETLGILRSVLDDAEFKTLVGLSAEQCTRLEAKCLTTQERPGWVDAWDHVCATADLAPDNFGLRRTGDGEQMATFDWGTAQLGPMELDMGILLRRIQEVDEGTRSELLNDYLRTYEERTGRRIDGEAFRARMPWARYMFHQRLIADHVRSLRWVPHQTRSKELISLFIDLCDRMRDALPDSATRAA